jgi:hypothetical protein
VGSSYLVCPKRSYESQKVLRSQLRSGRVDASLIAFVGWELLLPLCSLDGIFRSWCRSLKHDVGVDLRSGACNPLENAENDDWFYEVRQICRLISLCLLTSRAYVSPNRKHSSGLPRA